MVVLDLARRNLARAAAVDDFDVLAPGQALRDPAGIYRHVASSDHHHRLRHLRVLARVHPAQEADHGYYTSAGLHRERPIPTSSQDLIHFYLDIDPNGEEYIGYVAVMTL